MRTLHDYMVLYVTMKHEEERKKKRVRRTAAAGRGTGAQPHFPGSLYVCLCVDSTHTLWMYYKERESNQPGISFMRRNARSFYTTEPFFSYTLRVHDSRLGLL